MSSIFRKNAVLAYICSVYSFSKADEDKKLWLLLLDLLSKRGRASNHTGSDIGGCTGCNTGGWASYDTNREKANIDPWIIRLAWVWIISLAEVSHSSLSKGAILGYLWGRVIFTVS